MSSIWLVVTFLGGMVFMLAVLLLVAPPEPKPRPYNVIIELWKTNPAMFVDDMNRAGLTTEQKAFLCRNWFLIKQDD